MATNVVGQNKTKVVSILLRLGLAIVFLYAGFFSLKDPLEWIGYIPTYLVHGLSASDILKLIGVVEVVLGLWLLVGKYARFAAVVSTLLLAGVIITNWGQMYIVFRDFGLLFAAVALFVLES